MLQEIPEHEAVQVFPFQLTEMPREWSFQLPVRIRSTLTSIKNAFLDRFKSTVPFNIEILDLKQKENETVEDYIQSKKAAIDSNVQEDFITTRTMRGLPSNTKYYGRPEVKSDCSTNDYQGDRN